MEKKILFINLNKVIKKIAFRLDISSKIGNGHLKRLQYLGSRLKKKRILWFISGEKKLIDFFLKRKKYFQG